MSMRLALEANDVIRAVAMVGAGLHEAEKQSHPDPRPVSVLFIRGTADPCYPYLGGDTHAPNFGPFHGATHGRVLSLQDDVAYWCVADQCNPTPETVTLPHLTQDDTSTTVERYAGKNGKDVVAYTVTGGGHCWPGGKQYLPVSVIGRTTYDFSASEAIWHFFERESTPQ